MLDKVGDAKPPSTSSHPPIRSRDLSALYVLQGGSEIRCHVHASHGRIRRVLFDEIGPSFASLPSIPV